MKAQEPGSTDYPFSGRVFRLTHRPLDRPDPAVTILSSDSGGPTVVACAGNAVRVRLGARS